MLHGAAPCSPPPPLHMPASHCGKGVLLAPLWQQSQKWEQPDFVTPLCVAHDKDTKLSSWEKTGAFFWPRPDNNASLFTCHSVQHSVWDKLFFSLSLPLFPSQQQILSADRQSGSPSAAVHPKSYILSFLFQRQCQVAMLLTLCGVNTQWSFKDVSFTSRKM